MDGIGNAAGSSQPGEYFALGLGSESRTMLGAWPLLQRDMPTNTLKLRDGFAIASVVFGEAGQTIDCVAKLEGSLGARIELSDADRLPDHFLLIAMSIQTKRSCEVIERGETWVRARFIEG